MTEKLLPCPFCGGTPILELFNDGFFDYARIQCCRVIFDWCEDKTGEQAIAAWNRRAELENKPLAPEVDAVPVVRGEWFVTDAYPHRVYCSLCYKTNVLNEEWLYEKNDYPKYCMWCGAKMESEGGA